MAAQVPVSLRIRARRLQGQRLTTIMARTSGCSPGDQSRDFIVHPLARFTGSYKLELTVAQDSDAAGQFDTACRTFS